MAAAEPAGQYAPAAHGVPAGVVAPAPHVVPALHGFDVLDVLPCAVQ